MLKRLLVIVAIPCLLYGWGADFRVASSDASQGLFNVFSMEIADLDRQVVYAVQNASPHYYLRVYLEDENLRGTFYEASPPCPQNAPVEELFTVSLGSDILVVVYTPTSIFSNLWLIPYHYDYSRKGYSWNSSEIKPIDNAPNDTILLPKFHVATTSGGDVILFLSCVKRAGGIDSSFIYVSRDSGNTWNKVFISEAGSRRIYKDIDIIIEQTLNSDTIYVWRAYATTSDDSIYTIGIKKFRFDPSSNRFYQVHNWLIPNDTLINKLKIECFLRRGILAYDANGRIKVQRFSSDSLIRTPLLVTDPSENYKLTGLVNGLEYEHGQFIPYFALSYTSAAPSLVPNTHPIIYRETPDGLWFTSAETLNNNPCENAILTSYPTGFWELEPAVGYIEVFWHWSSAPYPHIVRDSTVLYVDRSYIIQTVRENVLNKNNDKSIFTKGPINLNFSIDGKSLPLQIELYSIDGRRFRTVFEGVSSNKLNLSFDISDLSPGLYFLKEKNGRVPTVRIIKQ